MITLIVVVFLSVLTATVGIRAARLWHRSSLLYANPSWTENGGIEPMDQSQSLAGWIVGINKFNNETAALNKRAAQLTALSVILGAITTIVGAALPLVTR
jgi:hypothetical protein